MDAVLQIPPPVLLAGAVILVLALAFSRRDNAKIPVIGAGTGPFSTQIASMRSLTSLRAWVAEGYRKHNPGVFKVRNFQCWMKVLCGPELIDELRRAPDDVLSFRGGVEEGLQAKYTFGDWRDGGNLHVTLIKAHLMRSSSIAQLFPAAVDELHAAFDEELEAKLDANNEWAALKVMDPLARIICRTSNRVFVGLPLCRDPEYIELGVGYANDVVTSAAILSQFPSFLRPIVGRLFTPIPRTYVRAKHIMAGVLDERRSQTEEHGDDGEWEDKPDDFLQWILDAGAPRDCETFPLMMRLMRLNIAAIQTTTSNFVLALYRLAAEPERYLEPIREEAHEVLAQHGWTKAAMDAMHMADSFLRESLRHAGIGAIGMIRKSTGDYTFSNGTQIKKGELVCVATHPTHFDSANYCDAETFDGFRFYRDGASSDNNSEDQPEAKALPNRLVSISTEFLAFGLGRHACPGRFWAAAEMKAMLAYMVTHYDMKMERDGELPAEKWVGAFVMPDADARVMIRRREVPTYERIG